MRALLLLLMIATSNLSRAQFTGATLQVSGLTCPMCSRAVQKSLEKVTFIETVKANIKTQEYIVSFKKNSAISFDELRKAIEDAGFSVARLQVTGNFENIKVKEDEALKINGQTFYFLNGENMVLNGAKTVTIVEKDFLTEKAFRKYCNDAGGNCTKTEKLVSSAKAYRVVI